MEAPEQSTPRSHMIISSFPHYIYAIPSTPLSTTDHHDHTTTDNDDDDDDDDDDGDGDQYNDFQYFKENIALSSPSTLMNGTSLLPLPPRLQSSTSSPISCSRGLTGNSPANKYRKLLSSVAASLPSSLTSFSNKGAFDPFTAAVENIRKQDMHDEFMQQQQQQQQQQLTLKNALSKNKHSSNKLIKSTTKSFDQLLDSKMIGIKNKVVLTITRNRSSTAGLRWESLARCVRSTHPTNLTAWFGSAKKPPQGCHLNY